VSAIFSSSDLSSGDSFLMSESQSERLSLERSSYRIA
jgi:hypothetical protein